jgi:uncharacterized protein (DUF1499 family)
VWHRRIALALALLAVVLLAASGLGVRAGLWPFRFGFALFATSLFAGLAAAGAAAVALATPRLRARPLWVALVLGLAAAAVPLDHVRRVKTLPYINDITTDTENPPQFAPAKPYEKHFAELQRIGYPRLAPLELALPPAQAFAHALAVAREMDWQIVAADEKGGRLEATATTRWFGFKDDVVVRVAPRGAGSRIDVRSKSRVGRSDLGANAKRIQEFLTQVARSAAYHRSAMSTAFKLASHEKYVHVELAADYEIRPEGTTQLTMAIHDACVLGGQRRVLIEGSIARRQMGTMDSFGLGALLGSLLTGTSLACCFYGYSPDQQTQFFLDVTQNRGVRIQFFNDRHAALRWLGVDSQV